MGGAELRIGRSFDRESGRAFDGNPDTMKAVIEGRPVPVPTLGGSKGDPEKAVRDAMGAGARGIFFGRNVWRAEDSAKKCASLGETVHGAAVGRG